jgi:hypothetical protein
MTPRDKQLITKFLIGGAGAGAAVAGTSALVDYIKYLKNKSELENNPDRLDDDTIYVEKTIPGVKSASMLEPGLAVAGGATASLAAYVALSKIYQQMKKKQLQKDLDEAQSEFTATATKSASDNASGKPISGPELLMSGAPVGALILAALASGAITYQSLRKQFPSLADSRKENMKRKAILDTKPSRVETLYVDEEGNPIKMASVSDLTENDYAHGMAFAAFMAKQANDNNPLLESLFSSVANGNCLEMVDHIINRDSDNLESFIEKSASENYDLNSKGEALVAATLARLPETAPLTALAVMDTLFEKNSYFFDKAINLAEDDQVILCKIAAVIGQEMIKEIPMDGKLTVIDETEEVDDGEMEDNDEEEEGGEDESDEKYEEEENFSEAGPIMAKIMEILSTPSNKLKQKTGEVSADLIDQALN